MYRPEVVDVLLNLIPREIPIDEIFYLETYPDVKEAVEKGVVKSAAQHFVEHGFFEERLPMDIQIDEEDYLSRYPDVADGVREGRVKDASHHWRAYGRFEGRTALLRSQPYVKVRKDEHRRVKTNGEPHQ